ncbi:MAG: hypothetical protein OXE58_05485 [Acidobacteria bacterium]|nr:hypothetical protein [Acidobacteriota bacterium]
MGWQRAPQLPDALDRRQLRTVGREEEQFEIVLVGVHEGPQELRQVAFFDTFPQNDDVHLEGA